ncbi:putative aminohydrolase SsnA [bacterium]|nr:putative aminohydrolase SsnA [bacterium]MBU1652944.1 putative aminohydrolase SsnA [bacterium]
MPDKLLIKNGTIITLGDTPRVLDDHVVLIEDGLIIKVAHSADFDDNYDRIINADGKIILPGFINAHMHFYSTFARGLGRAEPAHNFNQVLQNLWWRLDQSLTLEDCYFSALTAMLDAIRHGTTTLIDHHASPNAISGSLDKIADAARQTGLRVCLCYETSDRDGPRISNQGLEENRTFIRSCIKEKSDFLKASFGLHAAFTLEDATLEIAANMGQELQSGFHIHVAEAQSDQDHNLDRHGMRVVERLHRFGLLGPKTIAAHCVHVDDHEIDLLAKTETKVIHNPQSNMNNAVGIMDLIRLHDRGVTVGLGTDAMTVNMLEELRASLWSQHLLNQDPSVGFSEVTATLLHNNANIASQFWDLALGAVEEGSAGDVIIVDYQPPTPLNGDTFLGHLVFGIPHALVDTTIVGGRILMENKKILLDLDEHEIAAKARELALSLWNRF